MEQAAASDYRPVSRLAVVAAALGGLSALAVVSPLGWVLPLVAIGVSLAALADVHRAGAPKAGGLAAVAGLALAVGFGAQAASDTLTTRWLVARRATATARHWIDAVRSGRSADALSVCAPQAVPAIEGAHPEPGRPPVVAGAAVEKAFGELAAVQAVAGCGAAAAPLITDVAAGTPEEGGWVVRATLAACGRAAETLRIVVVPETVDRQGGGVERWLVTAFAVER